MYKQNELMFDHEDDTMAKQGSKAEKSEHFVIGSTIAYICVIIILSLTAYVSASYDRVKEFSTEKTYLFFFDPLSLSAFSEKELESISAEMREHYTKGDFDIVIHSDSKQHTANGSMAENMVLGICFLHLNDPDQAISYFMNAAERNKANGKTPEWYLSLAYLRKNNLPRSRDFLMTIAEGKFDESLKAKELLGLINPVIEFTESGKK